jgi:hypothetical protein
MLFTMADMDADGGDAEPAEHERFRAHLSALAEISDADECVLLSEVLRDSDRIMAESVVIQHLDRRAAALDAGRFTLWSRRIAPILCGHELPERRLREWSLFNAIDSGVGWSVADLLSASDWLQRTTAQQSSARAALAVLAAQGRTRRIRNTARSRLNHTQPAIAGTGRPGGQRG